MSTLHHDDNIDPTKKLVMITFYNRTKEGVDVVDDLCSNNHVSHNTK